jgi:two-component system chemotaxis response regulator CheB
MYEMANELVDRVRIAARARGPVGRAPVSVRIEPAAAATSVGVDVVLVGTSTGGPQALTRVLPQLPADFPVPIVVVVHMPVGYCEALARRLDGLCALGVLEGHDGLVLTRGMVVLAPAGAHLGFERNALGLRVKLDYARSANDLYQPSVNAMFESAAALLGARTLAVVMTGMGDDGLEGARALRRCGARVLAEHESSCVVYGMPRSIIEAGLATQTCSLDGLAAAICAALA